MAICSSWTSNTHLDVEEILALPIFKQAFNLVGTTYGKINHKQLWKLLQWVEVTPSWTLNWPNLINQADGEYRGRCCRRHYAATRNIIVFEDISFRTDHLHLIWLPSASFSSERFWFHSELNYRSHGCVFRRHTVDWLWNIVRPFALLASTNARTLFCTYFSP